MSEASTNGYCPRRVAFVSNASSESPGGAEAYQRFLGKGLTGVSAVMEVARFHRNRPPMPNHAIQEEERTFGPADFPTSIIASKPGWIPALRKVKHLMGRPPLQPLAIRIFCAAYGDSLARALPADVDVIHFVGCGWDLLSFAALAEARRRDIPFSMTPFIHPGQFGDSSLDARLYRQADVIMTMSKFESEFLAGMGVAPEHLVVSGLAPASAFRGDGQRFRDKYGLTNRPLILFIARKQRYKGYHSLCAAMSEIAAKTPGACLVAIGPEGEPPYPAVPEGALLDLGPLNWTPDEQQLKADALAACDIYCMPSVAESFGIVYVEAWSYGKPVVAGMPPAVRELITDGVNGFCVEQQSGEIARVIARLLQSEDLRRQLGSHGRDVQKSRYTWDEIVGRHLAAWASTMALTRKSASGLTAAARK